MGNTRITRQAVATPTSDHRKTGELLAHWRILFDEIDKRRVLEREWTTFTQLFSLSHYFCFSDLVVLASSRIQWRSFFAFARARRHSRSSERSAADCERCPTENDRLFPHSPNKRICEIWIKVMDQAQVLLSFSEGSAPVDGDAASGPPKTLETIDPVSSTAAPRPVSRERLINKLNYLNFQNRTVLLAFEHGRYGHTLRVEARPQPCRENRLRCTWVDPRVARAISRSTSFPPC